MNKKRNRSTRRPVPVLVEIIGWAGVAAIFGAYIFSVAHVLEASDRIYHVLNLLGAAGIIIESYFKRDYEPTVLNILWALVAIVALITTFL